MTKWILLLTVFMVSSCGANNDTPKTDKENTRTSNQSSSSVQTEVSSMKYEELMEQFRKNDDVLYVVNFWATWCVPCVAELPEFLEVNRALRDNPKFKMYLVSLDMPSKMQVLLDFIQKENIDAEVILLDDAKRMNTWIPAFDSSWSGAIPATIMYHNAEPVYFIEGTLSQEELNNQINKIL